MTDSKAPPEQWWGACPFCQTEGLHSLGATECGNCGFRYRLLPWGEPIGADEMTERTHTIIGP